MELVKIAQDSDVVSGKSRDFSLQIEEHMSDIKDRAIPMNIDNATAVIYAELGFDASFARGLFCLSR